MATRCIIRFTYGESLHAVIYKHWDGYPKNVEPLLQSFFDTVKAETTDTRFNDPSYLAAKFIVFHARESGGKGTLNFSGIGVVLQGGMGEEHTYTVDCDPESHVEGRPRVTHT